MTPAVLTLVLVAAVAHAVWNLAAKTVAGKGYAFVLAYHGLSAILLAPIAIWLVATGARPLDWALIIAALVSAVLHIGYSISLQSGYDHAPLGVVYPSARGFGPVLTIIVAVAFLGERPSGFEITGALIVLAGIAVVTLQPRRTTGQPRGITGRAGSAGVVRGLAWGGLIGAFIAAYTLWDDFAVNHITGSPRSTSPSPRYAWRWSWARASSRFPVGRAGGRTSGRSSPSTGGRSSRSRSSPRSPTCSSSMRCAPRPGLPRRTGARDVDHRRHPARVVVLR